MPRDTNPKSAIAAPVRFIPESLPSVAGAASLDLPLLTFHLSLASRENNSTPHFSPASAGLFSSRPSIIASEGAIYNPRPSRLQARPPHRAHFARNKVRTQSAWRNPEAKRGSPLSSSHISLYSDRSYFLASPNGPGRHQTSNSRVLCVGRSSRPPQPILKLTRQRFLSTDAVTFPHGEIVCN